MARGTGASRGGRALANGTPRSIKQPGGSSGLMGMDCGEDGSSAAS